MQLFELYNGASLCNLGKYTQYLQYGTIWENAIQKCQHIVVARTGWLK